MKYDREILKKLPQELQEVLIYDEQRGVCDVLTS